MRAESVEAEAYPMQKTEAEACAFCMRRFTSGAALRGHQRHCNRIRLEKENLSAVANVAALEAAAAEAEQSLEKASANPKVEAAKKAVGSREAQGEEKGREGTGKDNESSEAKEFGSEFVNARYCL